MSALTIADYTSLKTAVASWAHRTDLVDVLPVCVMLAEAHISRELRLRKQIVTSSLATVAGTQSVSLPSDWLEIENVSIGTSPEVQLTYVNIEHLDSRFPKGGWSGTPAVYTIEGDQLLFGPVPSSVLAVNLVYYARFASLITASTNWLLQTHPDVYLFAVLIEVFRYTRDDEQVALYTQRLGVSMQHLQRQDDSATHSGSALRVRTI